MISRPLYWILAITAMVRLSAAWLAPGFMDPNEIYRTLEPIADRLGYSTRQAWEWRDGILFQLPILALTTLVRCMEAIGISSALAQAAGLRSLYALLSLFTVLLAWEAGKAVRLPRAWQSAGALMVGLWPELVFRSTRLMDYSLEASALAAALWIFLKWNPRSHPRASLGAGMILGMIFFVRPQSGLYLVALTLATREPRSVLRMCVGYGAAIAIGGSMEAWQTGREFLAPFFKYWSYNVTHGGAAAHYGADPWHRYFSEGAKMLGFTPFIAAMGAYWAIERPQRAMIRPVIFAAGLPFIVLSCVAHKEDRFIAGFIWLALPLALVTLSKLKLGKWGSAPIAILLLGMIALPLQLVRNAPRFTLRAELTESYARFGETTAQEAKNWPLLIYADPDFTPGGFYLRHRGPLCYRAHGPAGTLDLGDCARADKAPRLEISQVPFFKASIHLEEKR